MELAHSVIPCIYMCVCVYTPCGKWSLSYVMKFWFLLKVSAVAYTQTGRPSCLSISLLPFLFCVLSVPLWPPYVAFYGQWPSRLLCPWDSPGKNARVCTHPLLQGIFLTQGSHLGLSAGRVFII